jgi:CMP-N,N'-diacetyllegionaminic acid synthase
MKIVALIPARGGSKGIKNKNIIKINKRPLIEYSIRTAKKSKLIQEIFVSTDSPKIQKIAEKLGVNVPFLRPKKISQDKSTDLEFFLHFNEWYKKTFGSKIDYIVHLRPTTPFRDIKLIDSAILKFIKNKNYSSLRSLIIAKKTPYKMYFKKKNRAVPIFSSKREAHSLGRQSLPKIYQHSGYLDIIRPKLTIDKNSMVGKQIFFNYVKDKRGSVDIDNKEDLFLINNKIFY